MSEKIFGEHGNSIGTVVICCRKRLECTGFTTTCPKCQADYNWNGSRLAPRSQWGEETGEQF